MMEDTSPHPHRGQKSGFDVLLVVSFEFPRVDEQDSAISHGVIFMASSSLLKQTD